MTPGMNLNTYKTTDHRQLSLRTVIIVPTPTLPAVLNMRVRYWRLSITEVLHAAYPAEKANHWDIKCMQANTNTLESFGIAMAHPLIRSLYTGYVFTITMFLRKSLTIWLHSCNLISEESYFQCIAGASYKGQESLPTEAQ